jgi:hypothetical protein
VYWNTLLSAIAFGGKTKHLLRGPRESLNINYFWKQLLVLGEAKGRKVFAMSSTASTGCSGRPLLFFDII